MTAETSNARGDVVAERQAWYEQQIALAEGQWAAAFLDRWECGDDVPSKEHYVALWLAERAAPPPAAQQQQGQAVALPKLKQTHPSYSREQVQWVFGYNAALSDVMRLNQNTALAAQHQEPKS